MHDPEPTPTPAPTVSRELYTVYLTEPTGGTKMPTAHSHDTLASALVEAATMLAEHPGWGVEIAHRLHTITELARIAVPVEEWVSDWLRQGMAECVHAVESIQAALPAPRRRIAPLF